MATKLAVGQTVYVPASKLPNPGTFPKALHQTTVAAISGRSATVNLANGRSSSRIAKSKMHTSLGILVLRIGDFQTEATVLDPLAKSVLHFCRLLVDDASVSLLEVRSLKELSCWWSTNAMLYSHVLLVGHGAPEGVVFGIGGKKEAKRFGQRIHPVGPFKIFVSLCCETGRSAFGKPFSKLPFCASLIAPYHSLPGATASQFIQTFLANHLIEGRSVKVAFRDAKKGTPGTLSYRFWKQGRMQK